MTTAAKATLLFFGMAVAIGACGGAGFQVRSVATNSTIRAAAETRPSASVRLYIVHEPMCAYEEVAFLQAGSRVRPMTEILELMRTEAAHYGADALVLIDHEDTGGHGHGHRTHNYSAIAVSFAGGVCSPTPEGPTPEGPTPEGPQRLSTR